jgi:hypothetical protein
VRVRLELTDTGARIDEPGGQPDEMQRILADGVTR